MKEIVTLLGTWATEDLPLVQTEELQSPLRPFKGQELQDRIGLFPILRAGLGFVDGMLDLIPNASVHHLGLYREKSTLLPVEYYNKLPAECAVDLGIVLDPMVATAGTAISSVNILKDWGLKRIKFVCALASREGNTTRYIPTYFTKGLQALHENHPDIQIYVAAMDDELNEKGYVLPGLGDAGDRPSLANAEKRANHNATERARREHLNTRFQELASTIPSLQDVRKPSKSVIVQKSLEFIKSVRTRLANRDNAIAQLVEQNIKFRNEINSLRTSLGMPPITEDDDILNVVEILKEHDDAIDASNSSRSFLQAPPTPQLTPNMAPVGINAPMHHPHHFDGLGNNFAPLMTSTPPPPASSPIPMHNRFSEHHAHSLPTHFDNVNQIMILNSGINANVQPNSPYPTSYLAPGFDAGRRASVQSTISMYTDYNDEEYVDELVYNNQGEPMLIKKPSSPLFNQSSNDFRSDNVLEDDEVSSEIMNLTFLK